MLLIVAIDQSLLLQLPPARLLLKVDDVPAHNVVTPVMPDGRERALNTVVA